MSRKQRLLAPKLWKLSASLQRIKVKAKAHMTRYAASKGLPPVTINAAIFLMLHALLSNDLMQFYPLATFAAQKEHQIRLLLQVVKSAESSLVNIYREAARRIAEFSGICVEHLGTLGKSLYSEARYKRKDRSFDWPASPLSTAELLKMEVSLF